MLVAAHLAGYSRINGNDDAAKLWRFSNAVVVYVLSAKDRANGLRLIAAAPDVVVSLRIICVVVQPLCFHFRRKEIVCIIVHVHDDGVCWRVQATEKLVYTV